MMVDHLLPVFRRKKVFFSRNLLKKYPLYAQEARRAIKKIPPMGVFLGREISLRRAHSILISTSMLKNTFWAYPLCAMRVNFSAAWGNSVSKRIPDVCCVYFSLSNRLCNQLYHIVHTWGTHLFIWIRRVMYQQHLVDTPIYAVRALIACNAGIGLKELSH